MLRRRDNQPKKKAKDSGDSIDQKRFVIHGSRSTCIGQVFLEFTFCMIIIFLMIYAVIKVFEWSGKDLAERRLSHDGLIVTAINSGYGSCVEWDDSGGFPVCTLWSTSATGPLKQIDPYFYTPIGLDAIWNGY